MTKKIFRSIFITAITVLIISLAVASSFLYGYFNSLQAERLKEELSLAKTGVENEGSRYFENFNSSAFRFTLIAADGSVLYDSEARAEEMENHLDREEISNALKNGKGSSVRYSSTITERTSYEAVRLENGNVLRISSTQVTVGALLMEMLPAISAIIILSVVLAGVLSQKMAKSIVKPLDELDLENPAENEAYDELTPVLAKINSQRKQISRQMRELKRKSDEFKLITDSMNEGLVLLDGRGGILSINSAAERLFNTDETVVGHNFLTVDRSPEMIHAAETALKGEHSELSEERDGREYRFMLTPTAADGKITGAVVLCIDMTEKAFAERNRREFTANVSHELKTPLQSIIGSAELLENGLVRTEDTEKFIGNIKNEALRLVTLINDIIRLSSLDEEIELPRESVDLYALANEAVEALRSEAEKRKITLSLDGETCYINGVRSYFYETVYNLCDNAIRYNKEGGGVSVSVKAENGKTVLSVADTGIGIPPEHQGRIFERFYRVDKSHSRETGGTGLGLSIVKHAVAYNGGSISLESLMDKGTKITVEF